MTNYAKPAVRKAWAESASVSDITDPGDTFAGTGWQQGVKPPRQYFNWVINYIFSGVRYTCQRGITDWDAAETYAIGAVVQRTDGILFRSIQNNNTGNSPTLNSFWGPIQAAGAPNGDSSSAIANTGWVTTNFLAKTSTFSSINGVVQNTQVPVGAVTQWQGALTIAGSQISSAVARSNSLLLSNGVYATFNLSVQTGQPSWLFGSDDGQNIFVWNPSNFSVSNSSKLAGLAPSSAASGSTIVSRDANGYVYSQYLNQASSNNESVSVSQVMVTNGLDGFLRKAGLLPLFNQMVGLTSNSNGVSFRIGPVLVQVGNASASVSGQPVDVGITFPSQFSAIPWGVFVSSNRSVSGNGQAVDGSNFASNYTRFGCTITVDSSNSSWVAFGPA